MTVRKLHEAELIHALSLVWEVFLETEGLSYSDEGKRKFHSAIHDGDYLKNLTILGAFDDELAGVIASRNGGSQIALFFVRSRGKGTGRMLFDALLSETSYPVLNVHSSLYAESVYHHLGFVRQSEAVTEEGITYVPMCFDVLTYRIMDKDNSRAFDFAEKAVSLSRVSDIWSHHLERLIPFLSDRSAFVRIRAAMIILAQAKWKSLDDVLPAVLRLLHDTKPTVVRQCLALLYALVETAPQYSDAVISEINTMDLTRYRDSMKPLIEKDIAGFFHI